MGNRIKGLRGPVPKGSLLMGRKLGKGVGDMEPLSLIDLWALGLATHQTAGAAATGSSKNLIQNQGILITNSAGETISNP